MYIVFLLPLAVNLFIFIIADWCKTEIVHGLDRTKQYKDSSLDNCHFHVAVQSFVCVHVFALMEKESGSACLGYLLYFCVSQHLWGINPPNDMFIKKCSINSGRQLK